MRGGSTACSPCTRGSRRHRRRAWARSGSPCTSGSVARNVRPRRANRSRAWSSWRSSCAEHIVWLNKGERGQTVSVYEVPLNSIDGDAGVLADQAGQVTLLVNVASFCGLTPQYEGLEALHEKYGAQGFAVIGIPCNQF